MMSATAFQAGAMASPWLVSRRFDLGFFHVPGLICLLLLVPYAWWGDAAVLPIFNLYLVLFGLPHNYLTWSTLLPPSARSTFRWGPILLAFLFCAVVGLGISLAADHELNDWLLSLVAYFSLWHVYRQHHGLCKIYDSIQSQRFGDFSIFADRTALNLFFGMAVFGVVLWAWTHPEIRYVMSATETFRLIHPTVPAALFQTYQVVTALVGIYAVKRVLMDRWRGGRSIPWPQISLMGIALLTYLVPYLFIPLEAMPLAIAVATIFHNIQYFGFVALFERDRAQEFFRAGRALEAPARWALTGRWGRYFAMALAYSVIVVAMYFVLPPAIGLALISVLGLAHYVIDGLMWRRDFNGMLSGFVGRLAGRPLGWTGTERFQRTAVGRLPATMPPP